MGGGGGGYIGIASSSLYASQVIGLFVLSIRMRSGSGDEQCTEATVPKGVT